MSRKKLKAISLFSGMGGDSLGLKNAGIKLVAYSEKVKKFQETHDENFKKCKLLGTGDITKTSDEIFSKYKEKIDIIFAGFPCQGFSNAGKKKVNDPRNTLFKEFLRASRIIQPDIIIGENVKGLLSRKTDDDRNYIDVIVEQFERLNYNVSYKIFKCNKYNIPQKRERLIIIGIKNKYNVEPTFPKESKSIPNLKDIVSFNMDGTIKISKKQFDFSTIPQDCIITDLDNEETESEPHPYLKLKATSTNVEYKGKVHPNLLSFGKRISPIHSEIIDIRKPSKTIICTYDHQPRLLVPQRNKNGYYLRCLLPDELKQIQGFPKDYKVLGSRKQKIVQIGNAVPPPLITKIVKHIKKQIRRKRETTNNISI